MDGSSGEEDDEYEEEVPRRHHRGDVEEDHRHWETGMRTEIPEFHGSLQPKEFLDWLATI